MRKSVLTWIAIVTTLLSGIMITRPVSAPTTIISVEPTTFTGNPGDIFSVDINITDVFNLYGYEFHLYFDTNVLSLVDMTPHLGTTNTPGFFFSQPTYKIWKWELMEDLGDGTGYAWLSITLPLGTLEGQSGNGRLATVQFVVDGYGAGYLDLQEVNVGDPQAIPISATIHDGYFSNVPMTYNGNLVGKSAWPEHHHFVALKDEDGNQTLSGKVKNTGTTSTQAKVVFTIFDDQGIQVDEVETETVVLAVGVTEVLSLNWDNYTVGMKYSIEARAWYDSVGNGQGQTAGEKMKPFSFAVV